jgi:hypothetical protein
MIRPRGGLPFMYASANNLLYWTDIMYPDELHMYHGVVGVVETRETGRWGDGGDGGDGGGMGEGWEG